MKPLFEDIRLAKIEFYGLLSKGSIDDSTLSRAASTIGEKQKAIDLQAFENFREIRKLCTAEQQPRYDSLIPGIIGKMWFAPRKGNSRHKENSSK